MYHHPDNFVGQRCYGGGDMMNLVCYVILQDQVTSTEYFYEWEMPNLSHYLTKFGGHKHCGSGYIMVLFCHVI